MMISNNHTNNSPSLALVIFVVVVVGLRSVLAISCVEAFVVITYRPTSILPLPKIHNNRLFSLQLQSKSKNNNKDDDDDDDDDMENKPGMKDAFEQLNALDPSIFQDETATNLPPVSPSSPKGFAATNDKDKKKVRVENVVPKVDNIAPEKEIQAYAEMMSELEQNEQAEAYKEMMADLGGKAQTTGDTYSEVIMDLGGTPKLQPTQPDKTLPNEPNVAATSSGNDNNDDDDGPLEPDTEKFMNDALKEAMKEVKVNNPKMSDSILNDKEIMKEIEAIFEQGNEKLMASLEEIRKEQEALAKESAERDAKRRNEDMNEDAERMARAQKSMQVMIDKVNKETAEVERAVKDLEAANAELDKDVIFQLKQGGLPKQMALVGFLLFSVRSIIDSLTSLTDASYLPGALIQGAVAIVCVIIWKFI